MDLQRARACLHSRFFFVALLLHRRALSCLAADPSPDSVDALVDALQTASPRLAKRICDVLSNLTGQTRVDRLWQRWAEERDPRLTEILQAHKYEAELDGVRELCLLKLGREALIPLSRTVAFAVSSYLDDPDRDVRISCRRYLRRLESTSPIDALAVGLQRRDFDNLCSSREVVDQVLPLAVDMELAADFAAYLQVLPMDLRNYARLRLRRLSDVEFSTSEPWSLLPFLTDEDGQVQEAARQVVRQLRQRLPQTWALLMLKLGRCSDLPSDAAAMQMILPMAGHSDRDVCQSVAAYLRALPTEEIHDEVLYASWLKADDDAILRALIGAGRVAPSLGVRTLVALLQDDLVAYLKLEDADGELFHEAWLLASAEQRRRLGETVVRSRNEQLINAYRKAMVLRDDYDLDLHIRALCSAGLDEDLFLLLERMTLNQVLGCVARWRERDWAPTKVRDRVLVDELVDLSRLTPALHELQSAMSPPGTVDALTGLAQRQKNVKASARQLPILKASAVLAQTKIKSDPLKMRKAARSLFWIERYAAALVAGPQSAVEDDHVLWVNVARGNLQGLGDVPVAASPDVYDATQKRLRRILEQHGVLARRVEIYLRMLSALHRYFCTGIELLEDNRPDDMTAIAVEEAPLSLFG